MPVFASSFCWSVKGPLYIGWDVTSSFNRQWDASKMKDIRIAAILPIEAEYSERLLEGAVDYCSENRHIKLVEVSFSRNFPPTFESEPSFDAAMLWLNNRDRWPAELIDMKIPLINTSGDWPHEDIPSLCYQGEDIEKLLVDHLHRQGYRDLLYLAYDSEPDSQSMLTAQGFQKYAATLGLPVAVESVGLPDNVWEDHEMLLTPAMSNRLRAIISNLAFPVGIGCENDYLGFHVCRIASDLGISIPQDLGVVGVCDYRIARSCTPPLSTVPQGSGLGWQAFKILDEWLTKGKRPKMKMRLSPPPIVCRESTGGGQAHLGILQKSMQIVVNEACNGITVGEIAERLSILPQTLTKLHKRAFGITLGEEIRRQKVRTAKHYLETTSHSVTMIAGMCGFNQQSKFSSFFKRQTGASPLQYRQRQQEQTARP